jgi:hypothetical protein
MSSETIGYIIGASIWLVIILAGWVEEWVKDKGSEGV